MVDKFIDAKGKTLIEITDDGEEVVTEQGVKHWKMLEELLDDVNYWEEEVKADCTSQAQEALSIAKQKLKDFREGKQKWD